MNNNKRTDTLKKCLFSLCVFVLFAQNTFAENISRQHLPEGVKARLGKGLVLGIVYSPDGTRLAIASDTGLYLYETASYREIAVFTGQVWHVAFSPDSRTIAGKGFADKTVRLWDAKIGSLKYVLGHSYSITSEAFSPDSKTLATGSDDDSLRLWDTQTGRLKHTLTEHTSWLNSAAFSPDSGTLATGSRDDTFVHLSDTETVSLQYTLTGHTDAVTSMAFSPDGNTLTTVSDDGTVFLWDITVIDDR